MPVLARHRPKCPETSTILDGVGTGSRIIEEWERGWHSSDEYICPSCIGDDFLRSVVARAVVDQQACSFCDAAPAAEFDVFMEAFMVGVDHKFEQVDDAGMPWDGGYVFTTYEQYELPDHFDWVAAGDHDVAVVEELRDRLVEKTYASRWWVETEPDESFSTAWKDFREQILHGTRFVFWARKDSDEHYLGAGDISVAKVLEAIGALLVDFDLITTLPAGIVTYRARGHALMEEARDWSAAQLGTNLPHNATSSTRMSPAGIPLFYGANDVDTALAEVARADAREFFTVGQFVTTKPMTVIDLTHVPPVPSIFDPALGGAQGKLGFLNELVNELRQPVDTARSNLDYVPTQVFCEYFLRVFDEADIRGLLWRSAAADGGGGCLALDVSNQDCVDVTDGTTDRLQLLLVPGTVATHRRRTDEFRPV